MSIDDINEACSYSATNIIVLCRRTAASMDARQAKQYLAQQVVFEKGYFPDVLEKGLFAHPLVQWYDLSVLSLTNHHHPTGRHDAV